MSREVAAGSRSRTVRMSSRIDCRRFMAGLMIARVHDCGGRGRHERGSEQIVSKEDTVATSQRGSREEVGLTALSGEIQLIGFTGQCIYRGNKGHVEDAVRCYPRRAV